MVELMDDVNDVLPVAVTDRDAVEESVDVGVEVNDALSEVVIDDDTVPVAVMLAVDVFVPVTVVLAVELAVVDGVADGEVVPVRLAEELHEELAVDVWVVSTLPSVSDVQLLLWS